MAKTPISQPSKMRPLMVLAIACLLLFELGVLMAGWKHSLKGNGDFSAFYRTAVMARSGQLHNLYDADRQVLFDRNVFPSLQRYPPYFFYHPPYEVPLLLPLAFVSYQGAFWLWTAFSFLLLGLAVFKFQFIAPLVVILALRRRLKLISAFLATAVTVLGVSWMLVGTSGLNLYWQLLGNHTPEMVWRMPNVRGLVESLGGPP